MGDTKLFGMSIEELMAIVEVAMAQKEEAKEFIGIFTPVVGEATDLVLDTLGPEVYKVVERLSLGLTEVRTKVFERYVANGFTRSEAMQLLINDMQNSTQSIKKMGDSAKDGIKNINAQ